MADTAVAVTAGSGTNIDTRTEASNGNHRQVVVVGDPSTNAGVAPVDATNGLAVDIKQSVALDASAATVTVDLGSNNDVTIDGSSIVLAEDAVHSTGAAGIMPLAVRNDTLATLADTDGDYAPLQVGPEGALYVELGEANVAQGDAATNTARVLTTGAGSQINISTLPKVYNGTTWDRVRGDATDGLLVNLGTNNDISGTVTANLSATDNTVLDNIDTNTTGLAGTVSGSELQVDIVGALPAGTAAIGKLAANSGVDIGDVDILSIAAGDNNIGNVDIVTIPDAVVDANHFHATITSADASTATQVKAKTAAKKIYVTSLMISVGSTALEVQLQSDNGTPQVVMEEIFLAANGGLTWSSASDKTPLFIVNTNEDLDVITSAAGDVTVAVSGYVV